MNNNTLILKIKERLNKLSSNDFDNIDCWQFVEAFNKAQLEWVRRQLRGSNIFRDGDENSKIRVDDLQQLLFPLPVNLVENDLYYESELEIPQNYFRFKRVDVKATSDCCENKRNMKVYLSEEDNLSILLADFNKKPSFEWGETFMTFINNRFRIYTNNTFKLEDCILTYYREPRYIQILDCVDPYTGNISIQNIECEFKDNITELIIDETASILAGDIESFNQFSRNNNSAERNN